MKKVKKEKALQNTNIYISEHLTTKNQELAAIGRRLKKKEQITASWVREGKVFVKTKGQRPEDEKTFVIKDKTTFNTLGLKIENLFN